MQLYTTRTRTDVRSAARKEIYHQALVAERWANAGLIGRLMMRAGI
ncbi:hypothetical protein [Ovoidimarina sediminis]|nr:hypothetical protein [Rhodophyticola sp. MJ-SS7]MDU8945508.1 hypothetical protein [Rhodophyticola sp. MJ-SS7]